VGGVCYHVLNRGNGRQEVFRKPADYRAFLKLLKQASDRLPMRLLAYCLLPNHFHLVLWPKDELKGTFYFLLTGQPRPTSLGRCLELRELLWAACAITS
jgi:putative transposase